VKLELQHNRRQTMADQLFEAGVEFPCGGESACGGCKVRVLEGEVPATVAMRQALSEEEIRDGWRLACCAGWAPGAERVVVEVEQWSLDVLTDEARVPIEPRAGRGAAIDLGTTTLVVQVVDLGTGEVLGVETGINPQARYGADVMSRLQYELRHAGELGRSIRETLGRMLGGEPLREVLVAGNTVMHHLFCGLAATASPTGSWDGRGRPNSCLAWADSWAATCCAASWPRVWTSRRGRVRCSTSAPMARWWWGRRKGLCARRRRPARPLRAAGLGRECGRAPGRSTGYTCATAASIAT
jgi:ferredoxin